MSSVTANSQRMNRCITPNALAEHTNLVKGLEGGNGKEHLNSKDVFAVFWPRKWDPEPCHKSAPTSR